LFVGEGCGFDVRDGVREVGVGPDAGGALRDVVVERLVGVYMSVDGVRLGADGEGGDDRGGQSGEVHGDKKFRSSARVL
jgi:hypothetical protein